MATEILPDTITLEQIERFAKRLSALPGTMAHRMAELDISAETLGIDRRRFASLSLCLVPLADDIESDIADIAKHVGVTPAVVRKAAGL